MKKKNEGKKTNKKALLSNNAKKSNTKTPKVKLTYRVMSEKEKRERKKSKEFLKRHYPFADPIRDWSNDIMTTNLPMKEIAELGVKFDPQYQRPYVWDMIDQHLLMESIFKENSLGTIVIQLKKVVGKGLNKCDVDAYFVDAVQRNTCIWYFKSNRFRTPKGLITRLGNQLFDIGNMTYSEILALDRGAEILSKIDEVHVTVRIGFMTPAEAAEEFRRTNAGKPLKASMYRNAMSGVLRDLMAYYGTGRKTLSTYTKIKGPKMGFDQDEVLAIIFAHLYKPYTYKQTDLHNLYLSYIDTVDEQSRKDEKFEDTEKVFRELIENCFGIISYNKGKLIPKPAFIDIAFFLDLFRDYELIDHEGFMNEFNSIVKKLTNRQTVMYSQGKNWRSWSDLAKSSAGAESRNHILANETVTTKSNKIFKCFDMTTKEIKTVREELKIQHIRIPTKKLG